MRLSLEDDFKNIPIVAAKELIGGGSLSIYRQRDAWLKRLGHRCRQCPRAAGAGWRFLHPSRRWDEMIAVSASDSSGTIIDFADINGAARQAVIRPDRTQYRVDRISNVLHRRGGIDRPAGHARSH